MSDMQYIHEHDTHFRIRIKNIKGSTKGFTTRKISFSRFPNKSEALKQAKLERDKIFLVAKGFPFDPDNAKVHSEASSNSRTSKVGVSPYVHVRFYQPTEKVTVNTGYMAAYGSGKSRIRELFTHDYKDEDSIDKAYYDAVCFVANLRGEPSPKADELYYPDIDWQDMVEEKTEAAIARAAEKKSPTK